MVSRVPLLTALMIRTVVRLLAVADIIISSASLLTYINIGSHTGTFLTFAQFLYVALQTVWTQLYFPPGSRLPRFRRSTVPISRWMVQVVLFVAVSLSA